jgi:WD40 repeat protein
LIQGQGKRSSYDCYKQFLCRGSILCQWSPDGVYLACAAADSIMFPLKIFYIQQQIDNASNTRGHHGQDAPLTVNDISVRSDLVLIFSGHHDIVYDLSWSTDGTMILTASADGTAKVWNTSPHITNNTGTIVQLQYEQQEQALIQREQNREQQSINSELEITAGSGHENKGSSGGSNASKLSATATSALHKVHTFAAALQHTCFVYSAKWHPTVNRYGKDRYF